MDNAFAAGDRFLLSQARLLERRLFAHLFLGQPAARVIDALRGYQNDDGGFGHGLEPDKRCPASLPIDVEIALQTMATAGTVDQDMVARACDFLARTAEQADAGGAVPPAFPVIESFPRAAHWTEWTYQPGINPTAGLVGLLYQLRIDHPWRDQGAAYCWEKLEAGDPPGDAHALSEVFVFLDHVPDQERAEKHAAALAAHLDEIPMFHLDPDAEGYGLTPLHLAPEANSRCSDQRPPRPPAERTAAGRRLARHLGAAHRGVAPGVARDRDCPGAAHADVVRTHPRERMRGLQAGRATVRPPRPQPERLP